MYVVKDAKYVKDAPPAWNSGEQPAGVILVDALWEECHNFEEVVRIGAKFVECRGGEGEFNDCCKALIEVCPKDL